MANTIRFSVFPEIVPFFGSCLLNRIQHSFPTRRSSDLRQSTLHNARLEQAANRFGRITVLSDYRPKDRKSTRLNSSHGSISYAVFCLKKKNYVREKLEPIPSYERASHKVFELADKDSTI